MRQILASALAASLAVPLLAAPAFAVPQVAGSYSVEGWNPGVMTSKKASYTGTLKMVDMGGWYRVTWTSTAFSGESKGVGYLRSFGDKWALAIGYTAGKEPAVALYSVSVDGKVLSGDWVEGGVGHEVATRR